MDFDARLREGIAAHQAGDRAAALAAYKDVLTAHPDHPDGLHYLGLLHFEAGKPDNAIALITKSLEENGRNAAAHNNLGNILKLVGRPEDALSAYARAVEADAGYEDAWHNINVLLKGATRNEDLLPIIKKIIRLDPENADAWHNYGLSLMLAGRREEAADALEKCLELGAEKWSDPVWHARVISSLGRKDRAIRHLEMIVEKFPDDATARYHLAAMRGETMDHAPEDYIRDHFDSFSDSFDEVLKELSYMAPELVAQDVAALAGQRGEIFADVVDLGCGTGLCGPLIRSHCGKLTGVDLSPGMLKKAAELNAFDFLVEGELVAFLNADLPTRFDLAVCVDTLCYFGALEDFFDGLAKVLKPGAVLVASVEHMKEGSGKYQVDATGRYAHNPDYIRQSAEAAGLIFGPFREVVLRQELGTDVQGLIFHVSARLGEPSTNV